MSTAGRVMQRRAAAASFALSIRARFEQRLDCLQLTLIHGTVQWRGTLGRSRFEVCALCHQRAQRRNVASIGRPVERRELQALSGCARPREC